MRLIKMSGLIATVAVAAMALMGASTASATFDTALCKTDPPNDGLVCPEAELVNHVHLTATVRLLNTIQEVVCDASFLGEVTTAGDLAEAPATLVILGNLGYTSCTPGCVVEQTSADVTIGALKTGKELAKVTGEGRVLAECLLLHCEYNFLNLEGHGLGGLLTGTDKGHVTFDDESLTIHADPFLLCPDHTLLDALFSSLNDLYLKS